jgi:hypothetical protein
MKDYYTTILLLLLTLFPLVACESIFVNEQSSTNPRWIKHPAGEQQCIPYEFVHVEDALLELSEAKITVLSSKTVQFPVCKACSCPVGLEYHAMISEVDLPKALRIGWIQVAADSASSE